MAKETSPKPETNKPEANTSSADEIKNSRYVRKVGEKFGRKFYSSWADQQSDRMWKLTGEMDRQKRFELVMGGRSLVKAA